MSEVALLAPTYESRYFPPFKKDTVLCLFLHNCIFTVLWSGGSTCLSLWVIFTELMCLKKLEKLYLLFLAICRRSLLQNVRCRGSLCSLRPTNRSIFPPFKKIQFCGLFYITVSLLCCGLIIVPAWVYGLFSSGYCVLKNLKYCIFCFCWLSSVFDIGILFCFLVMLRLYVVAFFIVIVV